MSHDVQAGSPEPLGVTLLADGVNVAVYSAHAEAVDFCLFDPGTGAEMARLRLPGRTGDVYHARIGGVSEGARYGLRAHGPFAPVEGHRFDASKLLLDPFAFEIDRRFELHDSLFSSCDSAGRLDDRDSAAFVPKAVVRARPEPAPRIDHVRPWSQTTIYELHVRGFTMLDAAIPPEIRGTFAALAHPSALRRLTRLGITAVEIMPAAAWIDERHLRRSGLRNYWGYNPVSFMAPDPLLAPGGWREIREAVAAIHAAGIEVLLDVVFNHTGEGDAHGPTLSLRGLDNASWYRLVPGASSRYIDDAGCGNCVALDRRPAVRLVMDSLRAWALQAGLDGFRFDLATTLGRGQHGFDSHAPLIAAIEQDPVLRHLRLIAEPWDIGPGGYQVGSFGPRWAEWNDRYRDDMRRFWRGDEHMTGAFATRLAGSSDLFWQKGKASASVNFITAHDGFTLADLVAFTGKHNGANGENNRDGTDANHSWNYGVEGATDDARVVEARERDQRNLLATLLLSRGTPMLSMGSEVGHSQGGNNNAYAQDNATAWIDWSRGNGSLAAFTGELIALRKAHRALHDERFLTGGPVDTSGIPDVAWLSIHGPELTQEEWHGADTLALQIAFYAPAAGDVDADRVLVVVNAGRSDRPLGAPGARAGFQWRLALSTGGLPTGEPPGERAPARTISVYCEHATAAPVRKRAGIDDAAVESLAEAAGIAAAWWDIGGARHDVARETKLAFLAAMDLATGSSAQVRESLGRLALDRDLRRLPHAIGARPDGVARLPLRMPAGVVPRSGWLLIDRDDGSQDRIRVEPDRLPAQTGRAADGRFVRICQFPVPPQPLGRHLLRFEDDPGTTCLLTVSPGRCFTPDVFERGERRFGIAAHLYTLHDRGCQGIGDFGTLATFARHAASQGASTIGLNPLHAMFGEQRGRVSPYQPSDRNFIDPVYLDLRRLDFLPESTEAKAILERNARALSCESILVDYQAVWDVKKAALEAWFSAFFAACMAGRCQALMAGFEAFIVRSGEGLDLFARHEAIAETMAGRSWTQWPAGFQDCRSPDVGRFIVANRSRHRFHMFLQWLCDRQLGEVAREARADGLALGFLGDLAIGMAPDGAEAWRNRDRLARGVSVGAPPDPLGPDGQNWGLPPLDPLKLPASGFQPFIEPVAASMRYSGALRIDHVAGLARLFWIPEGGAAADGAYVAYPTDDLVGQVSLESVRADCMVIGEDLGTIPEGLSDRLSDAGILSYRVLWFERDGDEFRAPSHYPQRALACVSTHDLPTLCGWWSGADIAERRQLGLTDGVEAAAALARRSEEKQAVLDSLRRSGHGVNPELEAPLDEATAAALHAFLSESGAWLMLTQADDLAGEPVAVNLPGTDRERPNWRRRISTPATAILNSPLARGILGAMASRAPAGRVHVAPRPEI